MSEADQVAATAWAQGRAEAIGAETVTYWRSLRGLPADVRRQLVQNFNEELLIAEFGLKMLPDITIEIDE